MVRDRVRFRVSLISRQISFLVTQNLSQSRGS